MNDILRNTATDKQKRRAWVFGLVLSGYIALVMVGGSSGGADPDVVLEMDPVILLALQGFLSLFMFVAVSFIFAKVALGLNPSEFFPSISLGHLGLVVLVTLCFMVVNSAIVEWNMNVDFPDSNFEDWAKRSEEQLRVFTEHLTHFGSTFHFMVALIVIAVIPGIGEELLFRGLIQNFFAKAFSNDHVAIWVAGLIFGAIHMQFYGWVPRMFLGVLFGYIYYWSGNLGLAMFAHFLNNGLALFLLFLLQNGSIEVSPEQMQSPAPWPVVLAGGLAGAFLMRRFYLKTQASNGR